VATGGRRLLALVVGVGKYRPAGPLPGRTPNDAASIRRLLTDRYGFPKENVCVLVDEQATTETFRTAFDRALVGRAQAGDVAIFYFSGHGSQVPDDNGDEASGWDQTLLLHDARAGGVKDLVDDELNGMLERLYARTTNVFVGLDSCNSGTATRGAAAGTFVARYEPPPGSAVPPSGFVPGSRRPWVPASLSEMVVFTAAADGTSALETGGRGIFTDALVQVLGQAGKAPVSYAQAARQIPGLVAGRSPQVPFFQGKLDREVFGTAGRPRPLAWEVKSAGPVLELGGPPLPGLGVNAELRIYAPTANLAEYGDPSRAKATAVVDSHTGLDARAHVAVSAPGAAPVAPGDLALLVRPSDQAVKVEVRLRPAAEPGGLPTARAVSLRRAIQEDRDARVAVQPTDGAGEFELVALRDGRLQLRGVGDEIRGTLASDREAVSVLWQLARQKALASLRGEGQPYFQDDETLRVEIVPAPAAHQGPCGERRMGDFVPRQAGAAAALQVVPMCMAYQVRVGVSARAEKALLIGGVVLSNDGTIAGLPRDGSAIVVKPGERHTFVERFRARPPLGSNDVLRIFGTLPTNPVAWHLLTSDARTRGEAARAPASPLHRAIERYLTAGTRGGPIEGVSQVEDSPWTVSTLAVRVEANPGYLEPAPGAPGAPAAREYTVRGFDVRPFLPDDRESALYRVLKRADALAAMEIPYKQHPWAAASPADNLKMGIDCSRAIWFAFTSAGLPYSGSNAYLPTADMVAASSRMAEAFDRCDGQPRQIGDVVVYRDDRSGDGHVVMVIDPQHRIAWGSQGWDGSGAEAGLVPDTGVEYQVIKYKPDWRRWDRTGMLEKACWRYRRFAQEARSLEGRPGALALGSDPCAADQCAAPARPAPGARPAAPR
jgi:hypothetical protein